MAYDATNGYHEWQVTLTRDGKELTCSLWTGGCEPTAYSTLYYLITAAKAVEWDSYEGWLDTMCEEDTPQHRAEYALAEQLAQTLLEFFGRDHSRYNEYLHCL